MEWEGHVTRMEQMRNTYKISVGKTEGKTLSGRIWRRWKDNTERDLKETGRENVE
jgi:hypothetical protein